MGRLDGRVAIVTGAGQGIGRGIARRFASEGADPVVAELRADAGAQVAAEIEAEFKTRTHSAACNVSDQTQVQATVDAAAKRFGTVDILVNNAWGGGGYSRGREEGRSRDAARVRGRGAGRALGDASCLPIHARAGRGRIVNLCSLNGVNAHMFTVEYNAAKEALRALTRTAAREWARHGITANVLCPAAATPAYEAFRAASPENAAALLAQNPMGRMGDPERDIGGIALFLASDDPAYLTGNTLFADGGSHINGVSWAPELPE